MSGYSTDPYLLDFSAVLLTNVFNLLCAAMFALRAQGKPAAGRVFGWAGVAAGLGLTIPAVCSALLQRPWWTVALPAALVLYCLVELVADGLLRLPFRQTRWLGPYLGLYYLGSMVMVGYAFLVNPAWGVVTLVTYFINLAATGISYSRVGHG